MSYQRDCSACMLGEHDRHTLVEGVAPGLIGGWYCGCPGDCGERWAAQLAKLRALLTPAAAEPQRAFRQPPDGWFTFGSHADFDGPMEFSDEKDECGEPLWERHEPQPDPEPLRVYPARPTGDAVRAAAALPVPEPGR